MVLFKQKKKKYLLHVATSDLILFLQRRLLKKNYQMNLRKFYYKSEE
jgi:hypothetical protein